MGKVDPTQAPLYREIKMNHEFYRFFATGGIAIVALYTIFWLCISIIRTISWFNRDSILMVLDARSWTFYLSFFEYQEQVRQLLNIRIKDIDWNATRLER